MGSKKKVKKGKKFKGVLGTIIRSDRQKEG